jgi:hypothetical protein
VAPTARFRRYRREMVVSDEAIKSSLGPSSLLVVLASGSEECCRVVTKKSTTSERTLISNFFGERFNFSLVSVHHVLMVSDEPAWGQNGILKDKIVLLGGLYHEAGQ